MNISSNSASIFVYKKTIDKIKPNTQILSPPLAEIIKNVDRSILIYTNMFEILIKEYNNYNNNIPENLMNVSIELCNRNNNEDDYYNKLKNVILFMNHFPEEKKYIFEYIYLYIKKYKTHDLTLIGLLYKKSHHSYDDKLFNTNVKLYIKWLLSD